MISNTKSSNDWWHNSSTRAKTQLTDSIGCLQSAIEYLEDCPRSLGYDITHIKEMEDILVKMKKLNSYL